MTLLVLGFIVTFTVVAVGLGWPIVTRLDPRRAFTEVESALVAFGIGGLIFYFSVFAIGSFYLDQASMSLLGAVLFLASIPGLKSIPWHQAASSVLRHFHAARRDWFLGPRQTPGSRGSGGDAFSASQSRFRARSPAGRRPGPPDDALNGLG